MKLPAVAIVACFGGGIAIGLYSGHGTPATSLFCLTTLVAALLLVAAGVLFARANKLALAAAASAGAWVVMGVLAARTADLPRAAEHIVGRVERGEIALQTPLRWRGVLRQEPAKLPWGLGYDIDLSEVDYEGRPVPVAGGLRINFSPRDGEEAPDVHAGDAVSVVVQAALPQVFRDEGAFDRRAYLASQHTDLIATLRVGTLLGRIQPGQGVATWLPRIRRRLRDEIDELFAASPEVAATMRAMLLGDRSFVERREAESFQKTGAFHILVVAGLHVGAIAFVLFWIGRRIKLKVLWTALFTLSVLLAYVAVVEQRPPVLRAAIMAAVVVIGSTFFRRLELLNSAAVAGLILLIANPLELGDSSFQLSFLAIGCIGGIAVPWLHHTVQPYARALRGWRDVTRDVSYEPRAAQFRIDLRAAATWVAARFPSRLIAPLQDSAVRVLALGLRAWELFVITLVLQLGMLPLLARDFHRVTLSGPIVNLLIVPLTGILVPLGFVALAVALILPAMGKVLALAILWIATLLLHFVQWFAALPRWSYRIPGPPVPVVLLFLISLAILAITFRFAVRASSILRYAFCALLVVTAAVIATYPFPPKFQAGMLETTVLDVGQGDSVLVVSPGGHAILIDGGGAFGGFGGHDQRIGVDPGEEAVSPYLWSRGVQELNVVALTHAHQDHIGGLLAVLENFRVGELWIGREEASASLANLEALARRKGVQIKQQHRGHKFSWDGAEGEVLWPETGPDDSTPSPANNDSLVLRLTLRNERILLPGDAEQQTERTVVAESSPADLRADVLKVGHHGGKNSSMPDFLAAVQPSIGIISAGAENPYGHPSPEVLERLERAGVRILRTDRDGAVHVWTDGQRLEVSCFAPCGAGALPTERQAHLSPAVKDEEHHQKP